MFRRRRDHAPPRVSGAVDQGARYLLREKLSITTLDRERPGEHIFYVDGKVLRVRDTVLIKDRTGNELIKLQKRLLGPAIPWPSSAAATQ
jgi:hypothetical protein